MNEGGTDFISIPDAVLIGDFLIGMDVTELGQGTVTYALGNSTGSPDRGVIEVTPVGNLKLFSATNGTRISNFIVPPDRFFRLLVSRVGSTLTMALADTAISETFDFGTADIRLDAIGGHGVGRSKGVYANLTVEGVGVLPRNYPINDDSNTIIDTVGGQIGSVVNGNPEDWGLFEKLPNGNWRGINLSAAWDSPNQILEVA